MYFIGFLYLESSTQVMFILELVYVTIFLKMQMNDDLVLPFLCFMEYTKLTLKLPILLTTLGLEILYSGVSTGSSVC